MHMCIGTGRMLCVVEVYWLDTHVHMLVGDFRRCELEHGCMPS